MVGVVLMICLRVLGFVFLIVFFLFVLYWYVVLIGFVINLLLGIVFFFGNVFELFYNWVFRSKIFLVVLGIVLMWWLVNKVIM